MSLDSWKSASSHRKPISNLRLSSIEAEPTPNTTDSSYFSQKTLFRIAIGCLSLNLGYVIYSYVAICQDPPDWCQAACECDKGRYPHFCWTLKINSERGLLGNIFLKVIMVPSYTFGPLALGILTYTQKRFANYTCAVRLLKWFSRINCLRLLYVSKKHKSG